MRRNTVLLWLLIVFASGTAVGVASHRFLTRETVQRDAGRPPSREKVREEYLAKMRDRVGASDEQIAQIVTILNEARANSEQRRQAFDGEMKVIQDQTREKVRAVLNPEQLAKYEAWREERKREREKHDRERATRDGRGR